MPFDFTIKTVFLLSAFVAGLSLLNIFWLVFLNQKMKRLLGGTRAKDIHDAMVLIKKELEALNEFRDGLEKYLETVESRLKRSVQGVETVRFNPFKGAGEGGNQSFSTAFIDENGDGVVVSSMYSRDRVSVFSKAVKNFGSDFELTEEERGVIRNVQRKLSSRA